LCSEEEALKAVGMELEANPTAGVGWPEHSAMEIVAMGGAGFPSLPRSRMKAEG
jgi:hypothetical protein